MPQHNSFPPFGYTRRRPSVLLGNEATPQILCAGSRTFSLLSQAGGSFEDPSPRPILPTTVSTCPSARSFSSSAYPGPDRKGPALSPIACNTVKSKSNPTAQDPPLHFFEPPPLPPHHHPTLPTHSFAGIFEAGGWRIPRPKVPRPPYLSLLTGSLNLCMCVRPFI
ncbi:hypothetical protein LZ31DRAFT_50458 [Colletotrichum somersetense]|nr:hypothetical protein LZ31DRAFT_50458 [Colletotrichum somersetense]